MSNNRPGIWDNNCMTFPLPIMHIIIVQTWINSQVKKFVEPLFDSSLIASSSQSHKQIIRLTDESTIEPPTLRVNVPLDDGRSDTAGPATASPLQRSQGHALRDRVDRVSSPRGGPPNQTSQPSQQWSLKEVSLPPPLPRSPPRSPPLAILAHTGRTRS